MKRREFIKGAATCAAGLTAGVNLFAQQTGEIGATNLTDGVDLSGAKNLGKKLAAMTPYLTLNNRILMPTIGLSAGKFDGSKDKNALEAALGLGYRLIDMGGGEEGAAAGDVSSAWRVLQRLYREGLVAAIGICDYPGEFGVENLAKIAQGSEVKPAVYQTRSRSYLRHFATRGKVTDHDRASAAAIRARRKAKRARTRANWREIRQNEDASYLALARTTRSLRGSKCR